MSNFNASVSHISMLQRPYGPRFHMDESAAGGSPAGGGTSAAAAPPETFSSVADAARFLTARRERPEASAADASNEQPSDDGADTGDTGEAELSGEDNAAPDADQAHGDDEGSDPVDQNQPPIARPKSWGKEDQAEWAELSRSQQEKIAAREDTREKAIRKAQNEAAENSKASKAKEQAAEQARTSYEQKAREAFNVLAREQQRDFADIKTVEDITKLAGTDPLRFIQWQAHQQELGAAKQAVDDADRRDANAKSEEWKTFRATENAKAIEHIPDLGDKAKAPKLMEKAVALLQEVEFTPQELAGFDKGEKVSLFDHRIQRLLVDAVRYRDMQAAKTAQVRKLVPHVQRPGSAKSSGSANSERIEALTTKANNSGKLKDFAALLVARRSSSRRAS